MNEMDTLANQNFLEWELRLKHVDEKMARAHEANTKNAVRGDVAAELEGIRKSRDAVALQIDDARSDPRNERFATTAQGNGIHTALAAVGLQLERLLGTIVGAN